MKKIWTDKQAEYINLVCDNPLKYNFQWGATGTGKTVSDLRYLIPYMITSKKNQDGLNIIGGVSEGTVKRNILEPLADFWGEKHVSTVITGNKTTLFGETVYILGAEKINQINKFQGSTIKNIFCDEVAKWHPEVFAYLHTRLRADNSQLFATFNPEHPKHFIHQFIENDIPKNVVHSNLYDNNFLSAQTIKDFEMAYPKGTVYYTRFILGLPCRAEGIIFPSFANNPSQYFIKADDVPKRFKRVEVGFDIGGNKSAYALTCTAEGYDDKYYVLKSQKTQAPNLAMEDIEKLVVEFCESIENQFKCDIEFINTDHVDVIINTINDNTRYRAGKTYKPPLEDRPIAYSKLLANNQLWFVEGRCNDLVEELCDLVFDDKSDKAIPLDDGTMQIDTYDSFTYSLSGHWHYLKI